MISSSHSERDSLLFVYGTLRAFVDIPMARRLRAGARYLGAARVRGRLYDLGAYPGLVAPRARDEWVVGDLYRIRSVSLLRTLDRYEAGSGLRPNFVRVRRSLVGARGKHLAAWLYLYRRRVRGLSRIAGGDYREHLGESRRCAAQDADFRDRSRNGDFAR